MHPIFFSSVSKAVGFALKAFFSSEAAHLLVNTMLPEKGSGIWDPVLGMYSAGSPCQGEEVFEIPGTPSPATAEAPPVPSEPEPSGASTSGEKNEEDPYSRFDSFLEKRKKALYENLLLGEETEEQRRAFFDIRVLLNTIDNINTYYEPDFESEKDYQLRLEKELWLKRASQSKSEEISLYVKELLKPSPEKRRRSPGASKGKVRG